jgi:TctA family transporter
MPRHLFEEQIVAHRELPLSWNLAFAAFLKYGLVGLIAGFLVWWITTKESAIIAKTFDLLQEHTYESSFMQHAVCINTAVLAGTPQSLCDVPPRQKGQDR